MNEHLMEILARDIVANLSPFKKEVYQYVVGLEEELASKSHTSEQFMSLLVKHSPHRQAASKFNLTFAQLMALMREIEEEIDDKLNIQSARAQWFDCTEHLQRTSRSDGASVMKFLFMI
ncbi:hypothetical protein [Bacillus sp. AK031]